MLQPQAARRPGENCRFESTQW